MAPLFFLLFASLLVAQETTPLLSSDNQTPAPTQVSSSAEPAPASTKNESASEATKNEPAAVVGNENNNVTPASDPSSSQTAAPIVPADPSATPSSEQASSNEAAPSETPAPLDPNAPASTEAEEPLKAPSEMPSEDVQKKQQQIKVRYYQVRAQVENDPEIVAIKQQAEHAPSDERKRQALRAYYDLLFKKMKAIDASISDRCDTMEAAYLRHLEQVSLEPTIPLTPFSQASEAAKKTDAVPDAATTPAAPSKNNHKKKVHHEEISPSKTP